MLFLFISCGIKPELLPVKEYPTVEELLFLKKIIVSDDNIKKIFFKNRIESPFFMYLKIKDISGEGFIVLKFYNNGKMIYNKKFFFGEEGKSYDSIILWDRIECKNYKTLKYAVFYNDNLIYEGEVEIGSKNNSF